MLIVTLAVNNPKNKNSYIRKYRYHVFLAIRLLVSVV